MHTIFINTTKNIIGSRVDALKHEKESKKLLCVDCPLETWLDNEKGYTWVTRTISKHIDTYNGVGNDFNLIIYCDLEEALKCAKIDLSVIDDGDEYELAHIAYKGIMSRFFIATLLDELNTIGRNPASIPLLLIAQPEIEHSKATPNIDETKKSVILDLMHVLPMNELKIKFEKAKKADNESLNVEDVIDNTNQNAVIKPAELYNDMICSTIDDVMTYDFSVEKAFLRMAERIDKSFEADAIHRMIISDYCINKSIREQNKEVDIKHDFLIQCFILDCVNENTLYASKNEKNIVKTIPVLSDADWEKVLYSLAKKKKIFEAKRSETVNTNNQYVELGLAPPLYEVEKDKFGLNEVGTINVEYKEIQTSKQEQESEDEGSESAKKIELIEKKAEIDNWLKADDYNEFNYNEEKSFKEKSLLTAEAYRKKAKEVAEYHLNIINKISTHVTSTMVRYSARSLTNQPPILRKRSVDSVNDDSSCKANDYKYAVKNGQEPVKDETPEDAMKFAKQAYITIILEYLKFDSQRCIAVKSIKEQCEWCMNKVTQIENSLKKLFTMFVVLTAFLTVLYVPFVLVQWDAIVKNVDTLVVATASVAVPFLILYMCYMVAKLAHRMKMKSTWKEFMEKAEKAEENNREAVKAYDELMTKYIPALRWIYEYLLDVEFHRDCCRIANTKLKHHSEKLGEQSEIIDNLLEDLDFIKYDEVNEFDDYKIDYTIAFCEGDNKEFYSIISKEVLDVVYGRGGKLK